jgi:hypothetical protein
MFFKLNDNEFMAAVAYLLGRAFIYMCVLVRENCMTKLHDTEFMLKTKFLIYWLSIIMSWDKNIEFLSSDLHIPSYPQKQSN